MRFIDKCTGRTREVHIPAGYHEGMVMDVPPYEPTTRQSDAPPQESELSARKFWDKEWDRAEPMFVQGTLKDVPGRGSVSGINRSGCNL